MRRTDEPPTALGVLIRGARKRRGWSQDRLEQESGVARRTIVRWETGEGTNPDGVQLVAVADALEIDRADVLRAVGWLPPNEEPDDRLRPYLSREQVDDMIAMLEDMKRRTEPATESDETESQYKQSRDDRKQA